MLFDFCLVDIVCIAVVSARPFIDWIGISLFAWECFEAVQHAPGACRWDSCILIYLNPSGSCVRIAIVPLMLFDLLLSAHDLFKL